MPDFYPQEKGVIRRDRAGEARDVMARELMMESLGMIPIGGMAAKMSSPAVDVLGRWIRRFRTKKGKPPTVPAKHLEKAIRQEEVRRGVLRFDPQTGEQLKYNSPTIEVMEQLNPQRSIRHPLRPESGSYVTGGQPRNLGSTERDDFKRLEEFMHLLRGQDLDLDDARYLRSLGSEAGPFRRTGR